MPDVSSLKFLIATATDVEDDAVIAALTKSGYSKRSPAAFGTGIVDRYVKFGSAEILICRTSPGGSGTSGSHLAVFDAVQHFDPTYVISSGICFGLKRDSQGIGQVLVSSMVIDYELVRQGDQLVERGPRLTSGPTLLSAARSVMRHRRATGRDVRASDGQLVCGDKLVDSSDFVEQLRGRFPDALGGEMEGIGVSAAAAAKGREWIIVKSICDWGFNKDKRSQAAAAQNSAEFVVELVDHLVDAAPPSKSSHT